MVILYVQKKKLLETVVLGMQTSVSIADMEMTTPVCALLEAIAKFDTKAKFARALREQSGKPITWPHVNNWIKRGKGASAEYAPSIEAISGVPCERLRPGVCWHVLRESSASPSQSHGRETGDAVTSLHSDCRDGLSNPEQLKK